MVLGTGEHHRRNRRHCFIYETPVVLGRLLIWPVAGAAVRAAGPEFEVPVKLRAAWVEA